jgi:glutamyl-Q tRNA(Asp) synthetase
VRIDDLDPERCRAAAADEIRRTLEACGLFWDREIVFQSRNAERYAGALERLQEASLLFSCTCSRKELADAVYPGSCRQKSPPAAGSSYALRLKTEAVTVAFTDRLQGPYQQDLAAEVGDFVIRRRDGAVAYHLATVLDDHDAGVTEVVRGLDLLPSTPRQIYLQQLLQLSEPAYCHVPVLVDADGRKLSKSSGATAVDVENPGATLWRLLGWLAHEPPYELAREPVSNILAWAIANWNADRLRGTILIPVNLNSSVGHGATPVPAETGPSAADIGRVSDGGSRPRCSG